LRRSPHALARVRASAVPEPTASLTPGQSGRPPSLSWPARPIRGLYPSRKGRVLEHPGDRCPQRDAKRLGDYRRGPGQGRSPGSRYGRGWGGLLVEVVEVARQMEDRRMGEITRPRPRGGPRADGGLTGEHASAGKRRWGAVSLGRGQASSNKQEHSGRRRGRVDRWGTGLLVGPPPEVINLFALGIIGIAAGVGASILIGR